MTQSYQDSLQNTEAARAVITCFRNAHGITSRTLSKPLLPIADSIARRWFIKTNNPYLEEMDTLSKNLNTAGVYALNACYEFGCTSAVFAHPDGPLLLRALDWPIQKLSYHLKTYTYGNDVESPSWPGFTGITQGIAKNRFTAALNQAPMRRHGYGYIGDWAVNRRLVHQETGLPPAHLLRQTLETARDYQDAVDMLTNTPIAIPVIYIIAGMKPEEGCIIERTETKAHVRPLQKERVTTANDFSPALLKTHAKKWSARPLDNAGRQCAIDTMPRPEIEMDLETFTPPLRNAFTQLLYMAQPKTGKTKLVALDKGQYI